MAYTSEQYKYLLLKRLQRNISMPWAEDRDYTYTFFHRLFEGVTVTERDYLTFVNLMDEQLSYCSANGMFACDELKEDDVNERAPFLVEAFAAIGISLEIVYSSGRATFTKPNGEVLVYECGGSDGAPGWNFFYIRATAGTEYSYAKRSAPYYSMENMDVLELSDCEANRCGEGCYWRYDKSTSTMRIFGDGTYYGGVTKDEQLGSGAYNTLVIGANVSALGKNSLRDQYEKTIVLLHASDFPLVLDGNVVSNASYASYSWDVYTDNKNFRNHAWPSNANITWHSLDEWNG